MWEVQESQIWYQEGIVPGQCPPWALLPVQLVPRALPCCLQSLHIGLSFGLQSSSMGSKAPAYCVLGESSGFLPPSLWLLWPVQGVLTIPFPESSATQSPAREAQAPSGLTSYAQ